MKTHLLDDRIGRDGFAAWTMCHAADWQATTHVRRHVTCRDCKSIDRARRQRRKTRRSR